MLIPVILNGGGGSRLWPMSRESHPKPFMLLPDGQSLLQKTYFRATALLGVSHVITVSNREFLFNTEDTYAMSQSNAPANNSPLHNTYVLEPMGRNTAAALACAVLATQEAHGDDATLLVLPSDHLITDLPAFTVAVMQAQELAQKGHIDTFGIQPTSPETGYGYILADGRYFWNSGLFCFKVSTLLLEMHKHCPNVLEASKFAMGLAENLQGAHSSVITLQASSFAQVPDISIDFAVMEKTTTAAVVPCNIGWSDIGSWDAISQLTPDDAQGNRAIGSVVLHNSHDSYIHRPDRLVSVAGMSNLVVVDTPDALLIANRDDSQDIKHIYAQLEAQAHPAHQIHSTVQRPWDSYTVIEERDKYKLKRIEIKPSAALSLQLQHHRSEHWIVVSGEAVVTNGDKEIVLQANQSTNIPAQTKHRLTNSTQELLMLIEVQCGSYLGEDDNVKFNDKYGRVASPSAKEMVTS